MADDERAGRLADLILSRAKFVKEESERRKDAKGVLEAYERDIAQLAESINAGQAELFEEA